MNLRSWLRIGAGIGLLGMFPGCASMEDIHPGDGLHVVIHDRSYDEVWTAALKVLQEHFVVVEQDKMQGIIKAQQLPGQQTWGEMVGVFIVPSKGKEGGDRQRYVVEVVSHKRSRAEQLAGTNWRVTILDGIKTALN